MNMLSISLLFLISMFLFLLKSSLYNESTFSKIKTNTDYIFLNDIANLLSNCSTRPSIRIKVKSDKDYIHFLNILSCYCKGIGFWGGFCLKNDKKYVGHNDEHDVNLAVYLRDLFKGKSVVDLGAGLGWYCPIISEKSKKCDQYDGSVNIEEVTQGKVKYLNLAEPIEFQCNYDIVMSIEVAEHIHKLYEEIYVDNLIKCSKEGILISWSKIGQGGHFHVNNKNKEDAIKLFEKKNLKYDINITANIKNATKFKYLRDNILYFKK